MSETTIYNTIRKIAIRAGIEKSMSPHWIRHSHATHALKKGASLRLIQETLGHAGRNARPRPKPINKLIPAEPAPNFLEFRIRSL